VVNITPYQKGSFLQVMINTVIMMEMLCCWHKYYIEFIVYIYADANALPTSVVWTRKSLSMPLIVLSDTKLPTL